MRQNNNQKPEDITKKLDMIIAILLARYGLKRKEIAETLQVSERTIVRMLAGNLNKIQTNKKSTKETN